MGSTLELNYPPFIDFSVDHRVIFSVVEGERLSHGYLFNPVFASEISLVDALPHQRMAVYGRMLGQQRLRFLLADDAGAGKTIMTGLYIREMFSRRLIKRVLIVPPAGLVGNWRREMKKLFSLHFKIVSGADCRDENPFIGDESEFIIISIDTLAGDRAWLRIRDPDVLPYDLVVFDEAHKLSADVEPDFRVRKTDRYMVAESLSGAVVEDERWKIPWAAHHLLLLTATPHMGKDIPYYFLWRLLEPEILATKDAFDAYPQEMRRLHFIRRTKEEMVRFDGTKIYPKRRSDTLGYELSKGPLSEEALYNETTEYIREYYNKAKILNRSAARFAMSIFQRRLASSTLALLRSFERRLVKLDELIEKIESGRVSADELRRDFSVRLVLDDKTGDEEVSVDGLEENEVAEDQILAGVASMSLVELRIERNRVHSLLRLARVVHGRSEESKFERLRELLEDVQYINEKFIIFTEYKDTLDFLVSRLEALGYTGQVAVIHGGMGYQEREQQIDFFKKAVVNSGARFLVATDAAGEGINLQFCWLMVNYDIPWNPARLEQRMGRIHRYGQKHDPVVILNLVSTDTREGRVLKTLLEKLEKIRKELGNDKVFDVVGRIFEGLSLRDYMEEVALKGEEEVSRKIEGYLTSEQVEAIEAKEHSLFGEGGDLAKQLVEEKVKVASEEYRRLLPGYVRRFLETAAPLLELELVGDLDEVFSIRPLSRGAMDEVFLALDLYPEEVRDRFTLYRPKEEEEAIFLRPSETVFNKLLNMVLTRFSGEALRGSVFIDPQAVEPYFVHVARVTVSKTVEGFSEEELVEERLVAYRHDGKRVINCSVEQLLLLRGGDGVPPSALDFVATIQSVKNDVEKHAQALAVELVDNHRKKMVDLLPERESMLKKGFDFREAELVKLRTLLTEKVMAGDAKAKAELARVRDKQRDLARNRETSLSSLRKELEFIGSYSICFITHVLVVPSNDPEDVKRYDKEVEKIAMSIAWGYEEGLGAIVKDVSTPELARKAGLEDNPGFDLLSRRPDGLELCIEVKGRAAIGDVELHNNEWIKACNHRDRYWLYVVYGCASRSPQLLRVKDPFGKLLASPKGGVIIGEDAIFSAAER